MPIARSELAALLERGIVPLAPDCSGTQLEALATLAVELERWGSRINLTGHRDAETIARRLILDAAALLDVLPGFASLADLGSGAGFPGLPMAVLAPDREFLLVESRERRHFFQRDMIRKLALPNVRALLGRFDVLEPICCEAAIAQAVASPDALLVELRRWAKPGGLLLVPGGENPRGLAGEMPVPGESVAYRVPLDGPSRTVWIARNRR